MEWGGGGPGGHPDKQPGDISSLINASPLALH